MDGNKCSREKNVGNRERLLSGVAGAVLGIRSLRQSNRSPLRSVILLTLSAALARRSMTGVCPLYKALGFSTEKSTNHGGIDITKSVTVRRPAQELFGYWRTLENLPNFMKHLTSVETIDSKNSRWRTKGALGTEVSWQAEITAERAGEYIAWKSVPGSQLENLGSVRFLQEANGETKVELHIRYQPPGSIAGQTIEKILGPNARTQVMNDLRRFKQLMEAGELASTEGQAAGARKAFEITQFAEGRATV